MVPGAEAGRLVRQLERLLVSAELLLHSAHLAEIPDPLGEAEKLAVAVVHPGSRDRGPELGAVLPYQPLLPGRATVSGGLGALLIRKTGGSVFRGEQVRRRSPKKLGFAI